MRRVLSTLPALALLAFAPACDSEDADVGDAFRNGTQLDINIQLTQADGGEEDGTILWELVEGEIYEGAAANGDLSLYIKNNTIYTSEGVGTCSVNSPYLNSKLREVIAANGTDVLFTVWNEYVFEGPVDVKNVTWGHMKKLFDTRLAFEFNNNEVYLGRAWEGYRLLSANGNVETASDGRKLLIAALITGECGASGMPGYTF